MKNKLKAMGLVMVLMMMMMITVTAQETKINTIFRHGAKSSGGYGALTNKFTTIRGDYANLSGLYGGWFVNHKVMVGVSMAATTNNIRVPQQFSADPAYDMSYQYGQFGLMTEYVMGSGKPVHLVFQLMGGAGFTLQYDRHGRGHDNWNRNGRNENWFVVAEPGVQLELNLLKWMRLSPGVSYRRSFGSDGRGLNDNDLSGLAYGASLKFGKF